MRGQSEKGKNNKISVLVAIVTITSELWGQFGLAQRLTAYVGLMLM